MVNLKTGKKLTRREFGKGLAAILAAGVAPSICAAATGAFRRGLGARIGAMGGGGASKPYDYEVEWLYGGANSSLGPRIEIPVDAGAHFSCKAQLYRSTDTQYIGLYYGQGGVYSGCCMIGTINSDYRWQAVYMGNLTGERPSLDLTKGIVYVSPTTTKKYWTIDGIDYPVTNVYRNSAGTFRLFYSTPTGTAYNGPCKIWWCKIYNDGTLTHDLIPVVKDGVGCMYDKVEDKTILNTGVGSFEIGPRIT